VRPTDSCSAEFFKKEELHPPPAWARLDEQVFAGPGRAPAELRHRLQFRVTIVQVLKPAGGDLSRENIMRQATNLRDLELPMVLPGIRVSTSPTDYYPVQQLQLVRFDGKRWVRFGDLVYDE